MSRNSSRDELQGKGGEEYFNGYGEADEASTASKVCMVVGGGVELKSNNWTTGNLITFLLPTPLPGQLPLLSQGFLPKTS